MTRATLAAGVLLALAAPVWAANRDLERLQVQMAGLQTQISELQRLAEENLKEVRRLNEFLAEQNASLKKSLQDQRVQDEALATTLKELSEKLAELGERAQAASLLAGSRGFSLPNETGRNRSGATPSPTRYSLAERARCSPRARL